MDIKTKQRIAYDFYMHNQEVIYLFNKEKKIYEGKLMEKLQDEPFNFATQKAEATICEIKENPLFDEDADGFFISKEGAELVVGCVKNLLFVLDDENPQSGGQLQNNEQPQFFIISNVKPVGDEVKEAMAISDGEPAEKPCINGFKVPSIYNLRKKRMDVRNLDNAFSENLTMLNQGLDAIKKLLRLPKKKRAMSKKQLLKALLDESNQEFAGKSAMQKLIYYFCLYPDITEENKKQILSAVKSGVDAMLILELMETDERLFSAEFFSYMIEIAKEEAETRAMVDLSKRLIYGQWYVSADVNGTPTKFMLRPVGEMPYEKKEGGAG